MQNCLVYISRNETHLGCGVLVEGALILTCRHVVAQEGNSIVPDQTFTISFPHCATPTDKPFETTATIIDACHGGQPNVDLVVLQPHRKPKLMRLQLAIDEDYEAGEAYVATALILEENEFPERTTEMSGKISPTYFMPVTRLRKFTGESGALRLVKGTSGSPVFIRHAQHLAGIVVQSVTGNTQHSDSIRETLFLPASLITPYLERALKTQPEFMLFQRPAIEASVWPSGKPFKA